MVIDMLTICAHFIKRWARQQAALGSRMARTDRDIVRIEQNTEMRIE